jgi:cell wall-associated NlpC family hydrolase
VSLAVVLTVTALPSAASAAPPPNVPTPQDIQNAKRSESAKQAEIAKLSGLVQQYQQVSDAAERDAQAKGEAYNIAMQNLDAATQKAKLLADQQKDAEKKADVSGKRAAAVIAQLARTGGGDVTLGLVSGSRHQTDQLLQRLGSMNRLSTTAQQILQKAQFDRNNASALAKQASVARSKRADLADDAQAALASAQSAADAANQKVASVQASQATMYAQLADLKGTTAALEQQLAESRHTTSGAPTAPPAGSGGTPGGSGGTTGGSGGTPPSGSGGGSPTPPKGVDPTPPAPSPSAVAAAIAFAEAQLGEPYVYGGAGPNGWDCSGLTLKAYASAGISLVYHGSSSQYTYLRSLGRLVDRRTAGIAAGDLLFYADGGDPNGIKYHVAMAIGGGRMIEAPYAPLAVRIVNIRTADLVPYVGRPTG